MAVWAQHLSGIVPVHGSVLSGKLGDTIQLTTMTSLVVARFAKAEPVDGEGTLMVAEDQLEGISVVTGTR